MLRQCTRRNELIRLLNVAQSLTHSHTNTHSCTQSTQAREVVQRDGVRWCESRKLFYATYNRWFAFETSLGTCHFNFIYAERFDLVFWLFFSKTDLGDGSQVKYISSSMKIEEISQENL